MNNFLKINRYSLGVGDRFAQQASAQLQACLLAEQQGVLISPTWNKSNREHNIVGSEPSSVKRAADLAVKSAGWNHPYYVDADHIGLKTVDRFLEFSNFFTIDVADSISQPVPPELVKSFADRHPELIGKYQIQGVDRPIEINQEEVTSIAQKYLLAVQEASKVYRHIATAKGAYPFITEISMDETDSPQTPTELLVILVAIADEGIPIQTIAPKFTGRFNKSVDYVGEVEKFEQEFNDDICVISHAIRHYGLPDSLKLSVHSGSDKFSIYPAIRRALQRHGCGVHVKTAGTTWLEEVIGLAEHGGAGLSLAKEIYAEALTHIEELCLPYATVIDIDRSKLPTTAELNGWTSEQYVRALRHQQSDPLFNPHLRQLLHVGFKVAAKMGPRYLQMLGECESTVKKNVTDNLFERHIKPLFL